MLGLSCSRGVKSKVECSPDLPTIKLLDVSPLYQTAFGCGPAALAMVLNYHGFDVSLSNTTEELYTPSLKGTLITDMRQFASRFVPSTSVAKSTTCAVIESVSKGNPVILFVDLGTSLFSSPHYIVVVGYDIDSQNLVFHNGYSEFLRASFGVINEKWEKMGYLALFIEPDRDSRHSSNHRPARRVQWPRNLHPQ